MGHLAPEIWQERELFVAGFGGEVVCDGEGEDLGVEAAGCEAGPALQLVFTAQAETWGEFVVDADAAGEEGVGEVGVAKGIVEVASAGHGLEVGDEGAIGAEVAAAEFIGALEGLLAAGARDLVELGFEAEMGAEVEVGVGGETLVGLLAVVGFGEGVAEADLEVTGARSGWRGLGMQAGCSTEQQRQGQSSDHDGTPIVRAG